MFSLQANAWNSLHNYKEPNINRRHGLHWFLLQYTQKIKKAYQFIIAIIGNTWSALPSGFFKYSARTVKLLVTKVIIIIISLDTLSTSTLTSKDVIKHEVIGLINCIKKVSQVSVGFLSCKHRTMTNC
jgi:hypothetical protein